MLMIDITDGEERESIPPPSLPPISSFPRIRGNFPFRFR
jgi:hypothetical protein